MDQEGDGGIHLEQGHDRIRWDEGFPSNSRWAPQRTPGDDSIFTKHGRGMASQDGDVKASRQKTTFRTNEDRQTTVSDTASVGREQKHLSDSRRGSRASGTDPESDEESTGELSTPSDTSALHVDKRRRHSLGSKPFGESDEDTEKRMLSFIVMQDTKKGPVPQNCSVVVDESQFQEAAYHFKRGEVPPQLPPDKLQPMFAVLYDSYRTLRDEMMDLRAEAALAQAHKRKTDAHRRLLSVKLPKLIDEYDLDYSSDASAETNPPVDPKRDRQLQDLRCTHNASKEDLNEQLKNRQTHDPNSQGPSSESSKSAGRIAKLEIQNIDLTRRHNAARQEVFDLKKERRAIQAERDRYRLENFKLQRMRSDERYDELLQESHKLQRQNEILLEQRQNLLQISDRFFETLPGIRKTQARNQKEDQVYWERERLRALEKSSGSTADQIPPSTISSPEDLMQGCNTHAPYSEIVSPGAYSQSDKLQNGTDAQKPATVLRPRQPTVQLSAPGKGLEESRRIENQLSKTRPQSILKPQNRVRGLRKETTRGSLASQRDQNRTQSFAGKSGAVRMKNSIDLARVLSKMPSDTPGSLAWHNAAVNKYEHQGSPLSGFSPFFDIFRDPPVDCNVRARVMYDVRGPDNRYNLHEFKQDDQVFVYIDGMHEIWPVKLSSDSQGKTYFLPRNAIAPICDHGFEYKEFYQVTREWPYTSPTHVESDFLVVDRGERLQCAHSTETMSNDEIGLPVIWRCMMNPQNGTKKGWVPDDVLQPLYAIEAPRLTASLCPCPEPQPYTGHALVLMTCVGSPTSLRLTEGDTVEVSHLDPSQRAYCVREPQTKMTGFIDPVYLRILRQPLASNPTRGSGFLELTPRFFNNMTDALRAMEVTEYDVQFALQHRGNVDWSDEVKQQWEQNVDGTNPHHKKFDAEMAKSRPWKKWWQWEQGLPSVGSHYIVKEDFEKMREAEGWDFFSDTWAFNPLGPRNGKHRARSKSLPALRNSACLTDQERTRERLMKKATHIGHQPHRRVADGICPDRDYMSEPVSHDLPDLKRKYIYINQDGTMRAVEAENEVDAENLDFWRYQPKDGRNYLGWRQQGYLQNFLPVDEDVSPPSTGNSIQSSRDFSARGGDLLEPVTVGQKIVNMFRAGESSGVHLAYQLAEDSPLLWARKDITLRDRFEIVSIDESNAETGPILTIMKIETKTFSNEKNLPTGLLKVAPSDLNPEPYLRTARLKGEFLPEYFTAEEREDYQFVLVREVVKGVYWDSLHRSRIHPAKLDLMEIEDVEHWRSFYGAITEIQEAYRQQRAGSFSETVLTTDMNFTIFPPRVDNWDFWYPVIKDQLGLQSGFVDVEGLHSEMGIVRDYVRIEADTEESGILACQSMNSGQTGLIHASVIDRRDPYLPMFELLTPMGSEVGNRIILITRKQNKLFVFDGLAKRWVDEDTLLFDEKQYQMVSLRKLLDLDLLPIHNLDEAEVDYLRKSYGLMMSPERQAGSERVPTSGNREETEISNTTPAQVPGRVPNRSKIEKGPVRSTTSAAKPISQPTQVVEPSIKPSISSSRGMRASEISVGPEHDDIKRERRKEPDAASVRQSHQALGVPLKPTEISGKANLLRGKERSKSGTKGGDDAMIPPTPHAAENVDQEAAQVNEQIMFHYENWIEREKVYAQYLDAFGSLLTIHGRLQATIPRPVIVKLGPDGRGVIAQPQSRS